MARPKKDDSEKHNTYFRVRCTQEEKQQIQTYAKQAEMSASQYIRTMALQGKIIIKQSLVEFTYLEQLNKIGVNLNQQTKKFNATGKPPEQLMSLWSQLEALIDKLMNPAQKEQ